MICTPACPYCVPWGDAAPGKARCTKKATPAADGSWPLGSGCVSVTLDGECRFADSDQIPLWGDDE